MRIKKVSQTTTTQAQIVDGYSESIIDGYSCDYVNNNLKKQVKKIEFNNEWHSASYISGAGLLVMIPFDNPNKKSLQLNIESAEIFLSGSWTDLAGIKSIQTTNKTYLIINLGTGYSALNYGYNYLVRFKGSIEISEE